MFILIVIYNVLFVNFLGASNGSPNQDRIHIDSLLTQLKQANNDTIEINILNEIAWELTKINQDSAVYYAQLALKSNKKNNYLKGKIKTYNTLGTIAYYKSNYKESVQYFSTAYELSCEARDTVNIAKIANNIGTIYQMLGDYSQAIEYNIRSLRIKEKKADTTGIMNSLINISNLYYQLNKFEEGIAFCSRAFELAQKTNSPQLPNILNTLGMLYKEIGEYQSAINYLDSALIINLNKNDKKRMAANYQNLATTYVELKDYTTAIGYYLKSLGIKQELGDEKGIAKTKMGIGVLAYNKKDYELAVENLLYAKDYYEQINQLFELKSIYDYLAKSYHALSQNDKAYQYLSQSYATNDSLYSTDSKRIIEEMEEKYETEKKELQIQKQAILIGQKNASMRFYIFLAILIGVGGVSIFLLYLKKQKAYKKLVEKNYVIATKDKKEKTGVDNASRQQKDIYTRLIAAIKQEQVYTDVDLTIDKLAKLLQTNRTELSEVIHLYTENSYPVFINEFRINHAVMLLIGNGQKFSIDAIATESGFKSTSNFYKLFKESTGLTPSTFQKQKKSSKAA